MERDRNVVLMTYLLEHLIRPTKSGMYKEMEKATIFGGMKVRGLRYEVIKRYR